MLSVGNTLGSTGASLSLDTRVAVGAGVFAVAPADAVAETPVVPSSGQKIPAYNAHEFSYRSDYGKIILLQQNVETGQELTQVPTEYHLRQYAATQREQRVQQMQKLYRGGAIESQGQSAPRPVVVAAKPAAPSSGPSVPPAAPAASQPAAPSVAPAAVAAPAVAVAHVDIKA